MNQPTDNLVVRTSFFVESGTYNDIYLRSYQTTFNNDVKNKFNEVTNSGSNIVNNTINQVVSDILKPSNAPTANVSIENGWRERRLTFVLEVEDLSNNTAVDTVVLTGYTSHADVSPFTKDFDPMMKLYFNASTMLKSVNTRMLDGSVHRRKCVVNSSQILNGAIMNNVSPLAVNNSWNAPAMTGGYNPNTATWLTPTNVVNTMRSNNEMFNGHYSSVMDFRTMPNQFEVTKSKRTNVISSDYLTRILRSVTKNLSEMEAGGEEDEYSALSNSAAHLQEANPANDTVLGKIMFNTNYMRDGFVTWGEMCRLFPNLSNSTVFTSRNDNIITPTGPAVESGNFENWNGVTFETIIANQIAQLVPAMLCRNILGKLSFTFTNDNINLTPQVNVFDGQVLVDGLDFVTMANQFQQSFIEEIAPIITESNRALVSVVVSCNLGTETIIQVSYDNGPAVPYCAPTFCDTLFSPIIATGSQELSNLAADINSFIGSTTNTAGRWF